MFSSTLLTVLAAVSASTAVVARPGLGVVEAMSHLTVRDLHDLSLNHHHASFARLRRQKGSAASFRGSNRKLAKRGATGEATLECRGPYAFALCDGTKCTDMGSVAAGTMCKDNAITWDTADEADVDDTPSPTPVPATTTRAGTRLAQAAVETIKAQNLHVVVAPTTTTAAPEMTVAPVVEASVQTGEEEEDCDAEDEQTVDATEDDEDCEADDEEEAAAAPATTEPAATPITVKANVVAPTTTTQAPPAATTTPVSSSEEFTGGKATFFYQGGAYGACGIIHQDSDKIVALEMSRYGGGSNNAPDCGRQVEVTNVANGKSVIATVADACPGCANFNSLDLSVGAFDAIGEQATGVLDIKWHFIS